LSVAESARKSVDDSVSDQARDLGGRAKNENKNRSVFGE
jgi:hypothetical protein